MTVSQTYSSKNTSVNTKKIPYIFNHINWELFKGGRCLDYGSGQPNLDVWSLIHSHGIQYLPYDPFWLDETINNKAMALYPTIVICSNLLNVIAEDHIVRHIHNYIRGLKVPYYIRIYEGDLSCVSRETKKDCYQRNFPKEWYAYDDEVIVRGIITKPEYVYAITPPVGRKVSWEKYKKGV